MERFAGQPAMMAFVDVPMRERATRRADAGSRDALQQIAPAHAARLRWRGHPGAMLTRRFGDRCGTRSARLVIHWSLYNCPTSMNIDEQLAFLTRGCVD